MIRRTLSLFMLLAAVALLPGAAAALSVSIDADPTTPGVQSFLAVDVGDDFTVDIVIQDVALPQSVGGFALTIGFDSSVLTATSVTSGNYLPGAMEIVSGAFGFGAIHAEFTFSPIGGTGDGVLASIAFDAIGRGASGIDFTSLFIARPYRLPRWVDGEGIDVRVGGPRGGNGGTAPVPEPTAAMLFVAGLLVVRTGIRRS